MIPAALQGSYSPGVFESGEIIVIGGNSLAHGSHVDGDDFSNEAASFNALLQQYPPINGSTPIANAAVYGQTLEQMIADPSIINSQNRFGVRNYLILLEQTNSSGHGATGLQMFNLYETLIATLRAGKPWTVIVITAPPNYAASREAGITNVSVNTAIDDCNVLLRSNGASIGVDYLCDIRGSGSPFNISNYDDPSLFSSSGLFYSDFIHLTRAGFRVLCGGIAQTFRRIV